MRNGCGDDIISIPALREEGDALENPTWEAKLSFLSTPSARRATSVVEVLCLKAIGISIHALREEGDFPLIYAP